MQAKDVLPQGNYSHVPQMNFLNVEKLYTNYVWSGFLQLRYSFERQILFYHSKNPIRIRLHVIRFLHHDYRRWLVGHSNSNYMQCQNP